MSGDLPPAKADSGRTLVVLTLVMTEERAGELADTTPEIAQALEARRRSAEANRITRHEAMLNRLRNQIRIAAVARGWRGGVSMVSALTAHQRKRFRRRADVISANARRHGERCNWPRGGFL